MADPRKRDSSWRMFKPGLYFNPDGCAYVFLDEIIAYLQLLYPEAGFSYTKHDYDLVVEVFTKDMRAVHPDVEIRVIEHEREKTS